MLKEESSDSTYVFNHRGWIADMDGANIQGLRTVYGISAVDRIKTCGFHFKNCCNRHARKLDDDRKGRLKKLYSYLLQALERAGYEAAEDHLTNFIEQDNKLKFLRTWFEWWNNRRDLIFPAFLKDISGPRMNQA